MTEEQTVMLCIGLILLVVFCPAALAFLGVVSIGTAGKIIVGLFLLTVIIVGEAERREEEAKSREGGIL